MSSSSPDAPIFINCRDRVRDLRQLVAWLERAGHERIILLDNDSTYEPLLSYLRASPHEVRWLGQNLGSRALWAAEMAPDEPFVYTDPDILPLDDCPLDAVAHQAELLERHPRWPKAALGLYLDDVPDSVSSLSWERELVDPKRAVEPGVFGSWVDTTFALYRPATPHCLEGLRCGWPYQARHMGWYEQDDEDAYYRERAIGGPLGSSTLPRRW